MRKKKDIKNIFCPGKRLGINRREKKALIEVEKISPFSKKKIKRFERQEEKDKPLENQN